MPYSQLIEEARVEVRHYIDQGGRDFDWIKNFWDVRGVILRESNLTTKLEAAKAFNEQVYGPLMQHNPKLQHGGPIDIIEIRIARAAQAVDTYLDSKYSFIYPSVAFPWEDHFRKLLEDILAIEAGSYERSSYLSEFNTQVGYRLLNHHPKIQYQLIDECSSCSGESLDGYQSGDYSPY